MVDLGCTASGVIDRTESRDDGESETDGSKDDACPISPVQTVLSGILDIRCEKCGVDR